MRRLVLLMSVVAVMALWTPTVEAQSLDTWFLGRDQPASMAVGGGTSYLNTLHAGVGVGHRWSGPGGHYPIVAQVELSTPLMLATTRDKDLHLMGHGYLRHDRWDIRVHGALHTKSYRDALSGGMALSYAGGLAPGYFGDRYFVAASAEYRANILTTFSFHGPYEGRDSQVLFGTNSFLSWGLNAGWLFGDDLEVSTTLYYRSSPTFETFPPYTQHLGLALRALYLF